MAVPHPRSFLQRQPSVTPSVHVVDVVYSVGPMTTTWTFDTAIASVSTHTHGLVVDGIDSDSGSQSGSNDFDNDYGEDTTGTAWSIPGAVSGISFVGGAVLAPGQSGTVS